MIANNLFLIYNIYLWCFYLWCLLAMLLSGSLLMVFLGHCLVKLVVLLGGAGERLAVLLNFATAVLGGLMALGNHRLVLFDHALAVGHGFFAFLKLNALGGFASAHICGIVVIISHYYKIKRENKFLLNLK